MPDKGSINIKNPYFKLKATAFSNNIKNIPINSPEMPPIIIEINANFNMVLLFIGITPFTYYLLIFPKCKNNTYKQIIALLKYIVTYDKIKKQGMKYSLDTYQNRLIS